MGGSPHSGCKEPASSAHRTAQAWNLQWGMRIGLHCFKQKIGVPGWNLKRAVGGFALQPDPDSSNF
jgi:hypothetical protein